MWRSLVLVVFLVGCKDAEQAGPQRYLESRGKLATALSEVTKPLAGASGAGVIDAVLTVIKHGKLVVDTITGFNTPTVIPGGWEPCMGETRGSLDELKSSLTPIIKYALAIADDPTALTGALKIAAAWDKSEDRVKAAVCRFRKASTACDTLAKAAGYPVTADVFAGNTFGTCPP
ncbi:MAG: hypothetical protein WKG01_39560 [Kofleriaceae bacterium]